MPQSTRSRGLIFLTLKIVVCLAVLLMLDNLASAAPQFKSPGHAKRWMKTYYLKPAPEEVPDVIRYMGDSGVLDNKNAVSPIFGFLSGVFQQNPEQVDDIVESLGSLQEHHLGMVVFGLWYSGLADSRERVEAIFAEHPALAQQFDFLTKNDPRPLVELPLEKGAWILDAMWGQFMATGSPEIVRSTISTLAWLQEGEGSEKHQVALAARGSLVTQARQHRKVRDVIKAEYAKQSPEVQGTLKEIMKMARKKK